MPEDKDLDFEEFCVKMYHKNCEERSEWNEELQTREDYILNNYDFLLDIWHKS